MVNRLSDLTIDIIIADRGYEEFNDLAHMIKSGVNYLIRAKDLDSIGILSYPKVNLVDN